MSSVGSEGADGARRRRRLIATLKESLRAANNQFALLNHHVGARLGMKDVDLNCLDLISRRGPLSPSALARYAGLHPATITGIVDRLQRGGWVARDRAPDAADRRAVAVRALRDRSAELFALYAGMNSSLEEICAGYTEAELEVIADFLRRSTDAGHEATDRLAAD